MEELVLQDKPGFFSSLGKLFVSHHEDDEDSGGPAGDSPALSVRAAHRYTVTVRRGITTFDDALEAAHGFKRGEQQILNLGNTEVGLRQKIVDFMCGVSFAQEGAWEELGENIYLVAPASAHVELAPATTRFAAGGAVAMR